MPFLSSEFPARDYLKQLLSSQFIVSCVQQFLSIELLVRNYLSLLLGSQFVCFTCSSSQARSLGGTA